MSIRRKVKIIKSYMSPEMEEEAILTTKDAFTKFNMNGDVAEYVRNEFDRKYG